MKIQDFCDMDKFEQIMKNWASSTGLATVAVGADGKYISDCYNFTEFCCEFPYKSRVMGTSEPLKPLKAPYMARNPVKWGFFRLKGQEIPLKI